MARVLVTGGAGYIGSHVVYAALEAGHDVAVVDDLSTGERENLPPEARFLEGDVGDRAFIGTALAAVRPEAVMHFAGSIIVTESMEKPLPYYRNNVAGSLTLIEACAAAGVPRFVFSSSAAVYGAIDGGMAAETAPLRPTSPYGWSKLMTERMLADAAAAHGFAYAALRYFNVAGADAAGRSGQGGPNATHLLKIACQTAQGKRPAMQIYGDDYPTPDGTCVRDYLHVSDLAEAHVRALAYLENTGGNLVVNCGIGKGYSVREVIAAVEAVIGRPLAASVGPRRPGDPPYLVADPAKIGRVLGWRPKHPDLETMIRSALAWESGRRSGG
ncbi:UDP-glucose 4-epimerase GalE [Oleispirillum naphthae]|uniref:UDP-glucose 4-epimerase GalE n=1 Tax=Oleispirillum naphthae TaxID=2838853 RepID=UPI0030823386